MTRAGLHTIVIFVLIFGGFALSAGLVAHHSDSFGCLFSIGAKECVSVKNVIAMTAHLVSGVGGFSEATISAMLLLLLGSVLYIHRVFAGAILPSNTATLFSYHVSPIDKQMKAFAYFLLPLLRWITFKRGDSVGFPYGRFKAAFAVVRI